MTSHPRIVRVFSIATIITTIIISHFLLSVIGGPTVPQTSSQSHNSSREKSCTYAKKVYSHGSSVKMDEPCITCSCLKGQMVCQLRMCPDIPDTQRKGCSVEKTKDQCCPHLSCGNSSRNSTGFGKFLHNSNQVGRNDDSIYFYRPHLNPKQHRTSTAVPSTIGSSSSGTQNPLPKKSVGCKVDDTWFADGSALPSPAHCQHCYCLKGIVKCIRPKCHLNITGCEAKYSHLQACCPTHYDCSLLAASSVDQTFDAETTTVRPQSARKVCLWKGQRYGEGSRIPTGDVCRSCFCVRGTIKCTTQVCTTVAPGCTPILQSGHCCPIGFDCGESSSTEFTTLEEVVNSTFNSNRIRENDRVIDFEELGNRYDLLSRSSETSTDQHDRSNIMKVLRPSANQFASESFEEDEQPEDPMKASGSRKPPRSAVATHFFPPRGSSRRNLFPKRSTTNKPTTGELTSTETDGLSDGLSEETESLPPFPVELLEPLIGDTLDNSPEPVIETTTNKVTSSSASASATLSNKVKTSTHRPAITRRPHVDTTTSTRHPMTTSTRHPTTTTSTRHPTTVTKRRTSTTRKPTVKTTRTTTESATTSTSEKTTPLPDVTTVSDIPISKTRETANEAISVPDAFESYATHGIQSHSNTDFSTSTSGHGDEEMSFEHDGHHQVDVVETHSSEYDGLHGDTSVIDWPSPLDGDVFDYFKEVGHMEDNEERDEILDKSTVMSSDERDTISVVTSTTITERSSTSGGTTSSATERDTPASTTPSTTTTTTTKTEATTVSSASTEPSTLEPTETTTPQPTTEDEISATVATSSFGLNRNKTRPLQNSTDSLPGTIFLQRVGMNFQVTKQKPSTNSDANWTSRLAPDDHPAADPHGRISKHETAVIQRLSHHEGRGSTRLLVSNDDVIQPDNEKQQRTFETTETKVPNIELLTVNFTNPEDAVPFQVIPFLPEDAIDGADDVTKNGSSNQQFSQSSSTSTSTSTSTSAFPIQNDIPTSQTPTNRINSMGDLFTHLFGAIVSNNSEAAPQPEPSINPSDIESPQPVISESSKWIPIRRGDPPPVFKPTTNDSEVILSASPTQGVWTIAKPESGITREEEEEDEEELEKENSDPENSSSPFLGLLSLFGFSGLGGAQTAKSNKTQKPTEVVIPPKSSGWLPLTADSNGFNPPKFNGSAPDFLPTQPISIAPLASLRLPNATGSMFLIGQPKEEPVSIALDHSGDWSPAKPLSTSTADSTVQKSTTQEPILEMILSHIHNSSSTNVPFKITNPQETSNGNSTSFMEDNSSSEKLASPSSDTRVANPVAQDRILTATQIMSISHQVGTRPLTDVIAGDVQTTENQTEIPSTLIKDFPTSESSPQTSEAIETTSESTIWDLLNIFANPTQAAEVASEFYQPSIRSGPAVDANLNENSFPYLPLGARPGYQTLPQNAYGSVPFVGGFTYPNPFPFNQPSSSDDSVVKTAESEDNANQEVTTVVSEVTLPEGNEAGILSAAGDIVGLEGITDNQPTQGKDDSAENLTGSFNPFILQVKGCNIYGKYYNIDQVIQELSTTCEECVCSGLGVDCHTKC